MVATAREAPPVSPPAIRLRRPGWRDPRLLLGVLLVALSVALASWSLAAAARTEPVYVTAQPLVPGEPVVAEGLAVREVRLGEAAGRYLSADAPLPSGLLAVRAVGEGEMVPLSAVSTGEVLDLRPVPIRPAAVLPSGVVEGSLVDLWFVPEAQEAAVGAADDARSGPAGPAVPRELAAGLTVAEVTEADGGFAVGQGTTVHVLVPVDALATVLAALAAPGSVEVVHVPGVDP